MKMGWETKRLGEVCEIIKGRKPALKATQSKGDLPYLVAKVMRGSQEAEYATIKDRNSITVAEHETIIICDGSNSGEVFTGFTGVLSSTMGKIAKKAEVDDNYLRAFLASTFDVFNGAKTGSAIPHLDKEAMYALEFPVPPLAEQQRIVGVLDEAFAGLATAQANAAKNHQNARALFASHLQSVFTNRGKGWVEKKLEECCEQIFAGGDVPKDRLSQERTAKFSVPIYSNGEKNDGLYGFTDVARVQKPSITVSARGTLGFTAIRTEPFLPVVRLIVLVPNEKQISLSFLYYAVVGMDFGNTGTSIPQLTVPNFKESKLSVPSLSEQEAIVAKLDALATETQRLESLYAQKQAALAALKKSLLHQAFTGQL